MLLLRDSIVVVLGLGVAGDAAAANAADGGGGSLFSFRGVAGGCACGCPRCRCECGGRRLGSGVDSLRLGLPAASDDATLVRGRASFVAGG